MTSTQTALPPLGFATRQLHSGAPIEQANSRVSPIYLTAGFVLDDFDSAADLFDTGNGYSYTRVANPTISAVERRISDLEGAAETVLVGSGQAAVALSILGLVQAGEHIVSAASIYEGTRGLFRDNFARLGISVGFVNDIADADAWERAIRPSTRVLFAETISNPKNEVLDIALVAAVAKKYGIPLVVDSTLSPPSILRPIEHGADLVVHSASKFLAGHGAVLGGAIVDSGTFTDPLELFPHLTAPAALGRASFVDRFGGRARIAYIRDSVALRFGPTLSPLNAFLIDQGIETLSLRVERQCTNALGVARWLEAQPEVESVDYAGLESSRFFDVAQRYLPNGHGAVFAFTLTGGVDTARAFVNVLETFTHMTHLGDVRSLILHPASSSHNLRTDDERAAAGIWPGTLRISIGIEHLPDLLDDLERGLDAVRRL